MSNDLILQLDVDNFSSALRYMEIPNSILNMTKKINVGKYATDYDFMYERKKKVCDAEDQLKDLIAIIEAPYTSSFTLCMTGYQHPTVPRFVAACIALEMFKYDKNRVIWHRMLQNGNDRLVSDYYKEDRQLSGDPHLIILDSISLDSPSYKFEKVREVIDHWDNCPIVIIGSGCDPHLLMYKKIQRACTDTVYFKMKTEWAENTNSKVLSL